MDKAERKAAQQLFALKQDTVYSICTYVLRNEDDAQLEVQGLFHASYEHFLRALVRFDRQRGELGAYLRHALSARLKRYVQSSSTPNTEQEREEVPATTDFRKIDIVSITGELVEEGRLGTEEEWDRLTQVP